MLKRLTAFIVAINLGVGLFAVPALAAGEREPADEMTTDDLAEVSEEAPLNGAKDISGATVKGSKDVYRIDIVNPKEGDYIGTIDGTDERKYKPSLTVRLGTATLKEGTDYKITSVYTMVAGSLEVRIEGIGAYSGTKEVTLPSYLGYTIAGANRYETAVNVARFCYDQNYERIVLVSGKKFPDALAAGAYAGLKNSPLLLVKPDSVPTAVSNFLKQKSKDIKEIVLIGGELKGAEKELRSLLPGASVNTIAGKNRYRTADEVTKAFIKERYGTEASPDGPAKIDGPVFVATGQAAADALSASPWSYSLEIPVILVKNGRADAASQALINRFSTVILLGSGSTVSDKNVPTGAQKIRLGGKNRWETSRLIADFFYNELRMSQIEIVYAPGGGTDFVDALAAGQMACLENFAVILVDEKHTAIYDKDKMGDAIYYGNFFAGSAGYGKGGGTLYNAITKNIAKTVKAAAG